MNREKSSNPLPTERPEYRVEMDGMEPQQQLMESPKAGMVGSPQLEGPVELPPHRY